MLLVASLQPIKLRAVQDACGFAPKGFDCPSGVAAQPQGRLEIRQGAKNRLAQIPLQALEPAIALETGIICSGENSIQDITCCLLRTRHGTLEVWSETALHDPEVVRKWLQFGIPQRSSVTLGSLYPGNLNPNDWYKFCNPKSRLEILSDVVTKALYQWQNIQAGFPARLPAALRSFKGVAFLDLQDPLANCSRDLVQAVRRLADRLVFDTVAVLDARGFLLAAEFMHENYPVVMIRKAGKLPADELHQVQFQKEYGPPDIFCLSKNVIKAGARVLVIDDVVATGNSMKAAEVLIQEAKGEVVAFLAPYALVEPDGSLMGAALGPRLRYHSTQLEAADAKAVFLAKPYPMPRIWPTNRRFIVPPSLNDTIPPEYLRVPVQWGQFRFSSNIWFAAGEIKDREIFVVMNPMQSRETWDVVQLLSILYRKDPKSVKVVIPFLEVSTQDRVEEKEETESLALVDTFGKMIGRHTVYSFDLHAEQSRFAYDDLRDVSLMMVLWRKYHAENPNTLAVFPDEGAAKRFGPKLKIPAGSTVVFRKKRDGAKRIMATDDEIQAGRSYVVIDDLVRSGATMKAAAQYLLDAGAKAVDALFSHAPFEPTAAGNLQVFRDVWTSDTCGRLVPPEWVKARYVDSLK